VGGEGDAVKWVTHLATSLIFALIFSKFFPLSILGLALATVVSILPDYLDITIGANHRGLYSHNLLIPLGTLPLIFHSTLAGFVIGYGHHLFIDSFTKQGVYLGKRKIKGTLYSKNLLHNILVILMHCCLLAIFSP